MKHNKKSNNHHNKNKLGAFCAPETMRLCKCNIRGNLGIKIFSEPPGLRLVFSIISAVPWHPASTAAFLCSPAWAHPAAVGVSFILSSHWPALVLPWSHTAYLLYSHTLVWPAYKYSYTHRKCTLSLTEKPLMLLPRIRDVQCAAGDIFWRELLLPSFISCRVGWQL